MVIKVLLLWQSRHLRASCFHSHHCCRCQHCCRHDFTSAKISSDGLSKYLLLYLEISLVWQQLRVDVSLCIDSAVVLAI